MFGLTAMANLLGSESILSANGVCNCLSGIGLLPWLGSQAGLPSTSLRTGRRHTFSPFPLLAACRRRRRAGVCCRRRYLVPPSGGWASQQEFRLFHLRLQSIVPG